VQSGSLRLTKNGEKLTNSASKAGGVSPALIHSSRNSTNGASESARCAGIRLVTTLLPFWGIDAEEGARLSESATSTVEAPDFGPG
jgi:hypothetical protein